MTVSEEPASPTFKKTSSQNIKCRWPTTSSKPADEVEPCVVILLALHNGEEFLQAQLDSLAMQRNVRWKLLVSDDGSTDAGLSLVHRFAKRFTQGQVRLVAGPRVDASANFMHMLNHTVTDTDYVAFCDQDDVWLPDKLSRAVDAISKVPKETPALYFSRRLLCNAKLQVTGVTSPVRSTPGFRNALVQNIAAGNTIMLNSAAITLLKNCRSVHSVPLHDWWAYLLVTGAGGQVIFGQEPSLFYRQHGRNLLGACHGWTGRARHIRLSLLGRSKRWNDANLNAVQSIRSVLTSENRAAFDTFIKARTEPLYRRLNLIKQSGVYRQSKLEQSALWMLAIFNRL